MNTFAFIFMLLGLQLVCFYIGKRYSTTIQGEEDYFIGGKTTGFFALMMTFLATQVGGGVVLGSSEEAYQYGWAVLLYPLGAGLGLIFLGIGTGKRLAALKTNTVAQIFETVYKSPNLKRLASLLSVVSLFIVLVTQVIASRKFMMSIGVDNLWLFMAFWGLLIVYTSLGGFNAVVATDVIQALFFASAFVICFTVIFFMPTESFTKALTVSYEGFASPASNQLYGWLLMPLLFMVIEQDMAQRCFAAAQPKIISRATICAGCLTFLLGIIPVAFGVWAKTSGIERIEGSSVLMNATTAFTTPLLTAFMGAAVIAAILSTADSLINAIGSNLAQDFSFFSAEKRGSLNILKMSSLTISVLAILCSFCFDNVLSLLILSYSLSVSAIFVPVFMALFYPSGNPLSAWASGLSGFGVFLLCWMLQTPFPAELLGLGASAIGFTCGELMVKYFQPAHVSLAKREPI